LAFEDNATITFPITVTFGDGTTQDTLTIIGIKPGADGANGAPGDDAVNAFLTNETHTVAADKDGNVLAGEFTNATTEIKIFVGTTDDTANWSITYSGTNITLSSGNVFPITAMSADSGTVTITGTKAGFSNVVKTFTVTKSRQGVQGETGAAGTNARVVSLTASNYVIVYDAAGINPSPSGTITLTATSQNFTNAFFKFTGDGLTDETSYTDGSGANLDTFTYSVPANYFATPKTIRVGVSEASENDELAFDTITITAVKPGQAGTDGTNGTNGTDGTNGIDGLDALTLIMSNEAHTLPKTLAGVITYTGSGTTIRLYEGATELIYDGVGISNST
jgi:hypothetical protein